MSRPSSKTLPFTLCTNNVRRKKNGRIKMPFIKSHDEEHNNKYCFTSFAARRRPRCRSSSLHFCCLPHFNPYFNFLRRNYISHVLGPFRDVIKCTSRSGCRAICAIYTWKSSLYRIVSFSKFAISSLSEEKILLRVCVFLHLMFRCLESRCCC